MKHTYRVWSMAVLAAVSGLTSGPAWGLETATVGSQATQATVNVLNTKIDTLVAALQAIVNGITYCNSIRKFYAPGDAKKDANGCVGVGDYTLPMIAGSDITLASGVVNALGAINALQAKVTGNGYAVLGDATANAGGVGGSFSGGNSGVRGTGGTYGIYGTSTSGNGVYGASTNNYGVTGTSAKSIGVRAQGGTNSYGIYADTVDGSGYAGYFNGSVGASAFYYNSDRRLKDDIKPLTGALDRVKALEGVTFKWKDNKANGFRIGKTDVGVIAQDVQKVLPEAVTTNKETKMLAVDYPRLVPLLLNAIKEQQAEIDALKQQVDALKK